MTNVLVLVPMKPTLVPALRLRSLRLLVALQEYERRAGVHFLNVQPRTCPERGDGRPYSSHAAARNAMLDLFLTPEHTHVLWIDADVVAYPSDLATRLHTRDADGIVAPLVLIEGTNRFYDTRGFEDIDGERARYLPPYFHSDATMVPMRSVGTCYLVPAAIYHAGARYELTPNETEHYSLCARAARVRVARDVTVWHADLPKWGERYHLYGE